MLVPARLVFCLLAVTCGAAAQTLGYVAGLQSDRRPDGAPAAATEFSLPPDRLGRALHGIEGQPPGNVQTVAATGGWWVPLRSAGMTPPYDLRGWHQQERSVAAR
ncbi:MAG: hypothetical protein LBE78_08260 [Burkholderiaceae bacterium]|nr:hypothetical protein [Burkholderiaceae bacterium]